LPDDPASAAPAGGSGHRVTDRRRFIVTAGVALIGTPLVVEAQQARTVARIGYLRASSPTGTSGDLRRAFSEGLRDLGWIESQTISVEERWAEGKVERLADLATELVRLKMDVIVAAGDVSP
jgi:hypothetical protein